jgi:Rod binding domain-containing protein
MTISANQPTPATTNAPARMDNKTLDTACQEFEGMLLGSILKQGIVPKPEEDEENDANGAMLVEFAAEQTARELSRSGITGIADLIKRQMNRTGDSHGNP